MLPVKMVQPDIQKRVESEVSSYAIDPFSSAGCVQRLFWALAEEVKLLKLWKKGITDLNMLFKELRR